MCLKVAFSDEALATIFKITCKWPVAGMRSHVRLEVASLVKLFDTSAKRAEQKLISRARASEHLVVGFSQWLDVMIDFTFIADILQQLLAFVHSNLVGYWKRNWVSINY